MEVKDLSLQGVAYLLFVAAGTQLVSNWVVGVVLALIAVGVLVLKAYLAKLGIAAKGQ